MQYSDTAEPTDGNETGDGASMTVGPCRGVIDVTSRQQWITWALIAISAIAVGIISRQPIVIPLPPLESQPGAPAPAPPTGPKDQPDPWNAIVRIGRTGVGCSATIIGPRRTDGRYWVLSACHCTDRVGERWTARFRDGRTTGLVVVARDARADYSWMLTDVDSAVYPYALLAERTPAAGTRIWHGGYGVDVPGNREDGTITAGPNGDGQIRMRLSVSSGDSGGGIVVDSDGRIVSSVCCTSGMGRTADVWGTSVEAARAGMVVATSVDEWTAKPIPIRPAP